MPSLLRPESSVAILLGASDWTASALGKARSFRSSASKIHRLLMVRFGFESHQIIDLFDSDSSANDQLEKISDRLQDAIEQNEVPIEDVIIYYIGHGSLDSSGSLTLLIKRTKKGLEDQTGLKVPDLAHVLKRSLVHQRYFIVLDCCFSESAAKSFMGPCEKAVAATAIKGFSQDLPKRGGLLLCACPADEIAIGVPDAPSTLFTGALVDVLTNGDDQLPDEFSFADLRDAVLDRLLMQVGKHAPHPVLHSVNQKAGDLSRLPAFLNPAQRPPEREAKDRLQREAAELEAKVRGERIAAQRAAEEQAAREATELEAKVRAERTAAEQAAKEQAERDAAERAAKEQAERDAAERAAKERDEARRAEFAGVRYHEIATPAVIAIHVLSALVPLFGSALVGMLFEEPNPGPSDFYIYWVMAIVPQWPSLYFLLRRTKVHPLVIVALLVAPLVLAFERPDYTITILSVLMLTAAHLVVLFRVRAGNGETWRSPSLNRLLRALKQHGARIRQPSKIFENAHPSIRWFGAIALACLLTWAASSVWSTHSAKQACESRAVQASSTNPTKLIVCGYSKGLLGYRYEDSPTPGFQYQEFINSQMVGLPMREGLLFQGARGGLIFAYGGRICTLPHWLKDNDGQLLLQVYDNMDFSCEGKTATKRREQLYYPAD